jgi:hypothetical protein
MNSKWIIAGAHEFYQLTEEIRAFCNVSDVTVSHNNYGTLTIQIDGSAVAKINSLKPLTWRIPLHLLSN